MPSNHMLNKASNHSLPAKPDKNVANSIHGRGRKLLHDTVANWATFRRHCCVRRQKLGLRAVKARQENTKSIDGNRGENN